MVVEAKNINQQRCFKLRERGSVGWCDVSKCGHLLKEQYVNYIPTISEYLEFKINSHVWV